MKKLIVLLATGITMSAGAQTLVLTNLLQQTPLFKEACSKPNKGIIAEGQYFNNIQLPTNHYFWAPNHLASNVITMTYTNPNVVVNIATLFGDSRCGFGSVTYTQALADDRFAFVLLYPTNVGTPPTNQLVPITVTGVQTNAP